MEIPSDFLERMKDDLPADEYPEFVRSLHENEVKALRINPLKGVNDLPEKIAGQWNLSKVEWEENGYYYEVTGDAVTVPGKHPMHEAGAYYIQEASAMYPVSVLNPQKNEKVLDLCAAPGGKSTQLASYMKNTGLLVCNEIIPQRAEILSRNIERCGVRNAVVTCIDPQAFPGFFPAFFDRILVDAPCSGEGMMRRGDAAKENWSIENVRMCAERQKEILNNAAGCLKPGGMLLYSTCTFSKEEDEDNVEAFLKSHEDMELISMEKLYPHRVRGEGHFCALFKRKGENFSHGTKKDRKQEVYIKPALDFLADFLNAGAFEEIQPGRIHEFKDSLYLFPEGLDDIRGMKVLRPGLCLGALKKGRFEPSHSLATAIGAEAAKRVYDVPSDGEEAMAFLKGLSLYPEGKKAEELADGWCLITFDGVSAGLGKKTGNVIKNHYPKGIRIQV